MVVGVKVRIGKRDYRSGFHLTPKQGSGVKLLSMRCQSPMNATY